MGMIMIRLEQYNYKFQFQGGLDEGRDLRN